MKNINYSKYITFCVVREPISRFVSAVNFQIRITGKDIPDINVFTKYVQIHYETLIVIFFHRVSTFMIHMEIKLKIFFVFLILRKILKDLLKNTNYLLFIQILKKM